MTKVYGWVLEGLMKELVEVAGDEARGWEVDALAIAIAPDGWHLMGHLVVNGVSRGWAWTDDIQNFDGDIEDVLTDDPGIDRAGKGCESFFVVCAKDGSGYEDD